MLRWLCPTLLVAAGAGVASAFQCASDVELGSVANVGRKGVTLDDATLQSCSNQLPQIWPNARQTVASIRMLKAWDPRWSDLDREAAWSNIEAYVTSTGAQVLLGTPLTCSEAQDEAAWAWTKEFLARLEPKHIMGLAVGNDLDAYQFQAGVSAACLRALWDEGGLWRRFGRIVSDFDALGFGTVPVTSAFTAGALQGQGTNFAEVPGKARVNSFLLNATGVYGGRFAFTWSLNPMPQDATQCADDSAGCLGPTCKVAAQLRELRGKMQILTGSSTATLWVGEVGWSSAQNAAAACPAWGSLERFQNFYRDFLAWDLRIGDDLRPPDHIFWSAIHDVPDTSADASGGGVQLEGLLSTCDSLRCKVRSQPYKLYNFILEGQPANRYCNDAPPLFDGWKSGPQSCQDACELDVACGHASVWPQYHYGLHWCRLTRTCESKRYTKWKVSVYKKEIAAPLPTQAPVVPYTTTATATTSTLTVTSITATSTSVTETTSTQSSTTTFTSVSETTTSTQSSTLTGTTSTQSSTTETSTETTTSTVTSVTGTSTTTSSTSTTTSSNTTSETSTTSSTSSTTTTSTSTETTTSTTMTRVACDFVNEPLLGYFWDTSCQMGMLGCLADGLSVQCRFCGSGVFADVACPASSCHFPNEPVVPYYWDTTCEIGQLGCWADGIHAQCRFCGEHPYTSVRCPRGEEGAVATPEVNACDFDGEPNLQHYWDPDCTEETPGCKADGVHVGCRFCGEGDYADMSCPSTASKQCSFPVEPTTPHYWDSSCAMGKLGCNADGIHVQCRFCEQRPFQDIPCPSSVAPPINRCFFPGNEPYTPYFWDDLCRMGMLGCWADGIHEQCRFCGEGDYYNVSCPEVLQHGPSESAVAAMSAPSAAGQPGAVPQVSSDRPFPNRYFDINATSGNAFDIKVEEEQISSARGLRRLFPAPVLLLMMLATYRVLP